MSQYNSCVVTEARNCIARDDGLYCSRGKIVLQYTKLYCSRGGWLGGENGSQYNFVS